MCNCYTQSVSGVYLRRCVTRVMSLLGCCRPTDIVRTPVNVAQSIQPVRQRALSRQNMDISCCVLWERATFCHSHWHADWVKDLVTGFICASQCPRTQRLSHSGILSLVPRTRVSSDAMHCLRTPVRHASCSIMNVPTSGESIVLLQLQ